MSIEQSSIWNIPSEMISMPQFFWSCGKQFLDPNAPTFQLKTSNLLQLNDSLGIVDYVTKSCTGVPFGEVPTANVHQEENLCIPVSASPERLEENEWVEIPVRELLAINPRCGWKRNRTQLCHRFINSFCARDCDCPFIHAKPLTAHRDQIIFLGGLPKDCTRASLFKELVDCGLDVLNYPLVLDRFTPRVVLKSETAAQTLIQKGKLSIFGSEVDVRAYKASNEVFQVFLGGLPMQTSVEDIRTALKSEGCDLVNIPSVNKGYVINCEVASKYQQQHLIQKGFIEILGRLAQVKRIVKRKRRTRSPSKERNRG
jgi:hypothetical protein